MLAQVLFQRCFCLVVGGTEINERPLLRSNRLDVGGCNDFDAFATRLNEVGDEGTDHVANDFANLALLVHVRVAALCEV